MELYRELVLSAGKSGLRIWNSFLRNKFGASFKKIGYLWSVRSRAIFQISGFFSNFKYCRFEQLRLVTLSNGCPKEVRNPKLSGIPHRSGILSKAIARSRGCNLASKFLSRRREIDRALFGHFPVRCYIARPLRKITSKLATSDYYRPNSVRT